MKRPPTWAITTAATANPSSRWSCIVLVSNTPMSHGVVSSTCSTTRLRARMPASAPTIHQKSRPTWSGLSRESAAGASMRAPTASRLGDATLAEDEVDRDAWILLGLQHRPQKKGVELAVVVADVDVRLAEHGHDWRGLQLV